jgi:5-methylcytosine-specific restriction protein A
MWHMAKRHDQRSKAAEAYRHLYKTARWQHLRERQLAKEPLCRMCAETGLIKAATTVDHLENHKGDENLFFGGKVQSVCKPCHDRHCQRRDHGKDIRVTGIDGWPVN